VEVPVADVSDWVFAQNGQPVGNFTGSVVNQARQKPQKSQVEPD
jgi:uncharacterized protein YegJ (DUF2314 family)